MALSNFFRFCSFFYTSCSSKHAGNGSRMKKDHEKKQKEIMSSLECPKDFECYKQGFENLCIAEDVGVENYIECLEARPHKCSFSTPYGPYGAIVYCSCPLRVYICKNLEK